MLEMILMTLNVCSACIYNDKNCNIIQFHGDSIKDTQVYVFLDGINFKNKKELHICRKCLMHLFYLKMFIDACDKYTVSIENKELVVENNEIKREDVKVINLLAQETKDKILIIGLGILENNKDHFYLPVTVNDKNTFYNLELCEEKLILKEIINISQFLNSYQITEIGKDKFRLTKIDKLKLKYNAENQFYEDISKLYKNKIIFKYCKSTQYKEFNRKFQISPPVKVIKKAFSSEYLNFLVILTILNILIAAYLITFKILLNKRN